MTRALRILIESGAWPSDEKEAHRLARQAVLKINSLERQAELYQRLLSDLSTLELEIICGGDGQWARQTALSTLDEIEAESRPN